jgi:Berberine and berberine like
MRKPSVVDTFYDSREDYAQLQQLKKKVDPSDIFSTIMTVKLP